MTGDPKSTVDSRAAAIDRLAAAQESLVHNLATAVEELHAVDARRAVQLGVIERLVRSVKRLALGLVGGCVVLLFMLTLIVSAVMPGVPLLRIHERATATTAKAVFDLQCTTLWANGYRGLAACAAVNATLNRVTAQP